MSYVFIELQCAFTTIFYIIAMFLILLFPIYNIDNAKQDTIENRALAQVPSLFRDGILNVNFGRDTEQWLSDHFYQRVAIIGLYNKMNTWLEQKVTGKIENNKAFIGKDNWIFYKAEGSITNFQNANLFSPDELIAIDLAIEERKRWLEQHGISFYIFIAPDKNRIYSEYYPEGIFKLNDKGRVEQLEEFLNKKGRGGGTFIYPYKELIRAKSEGLLYWKTDTHWNEHGAFIGYTVLMDAIVQDFPDIIPLMRHDFVVKEEPFIGGDLLAMLYPTKDKKVNALYTDVLYSKFLPKKAYNFLYTNNEESSSIITTSPKKYNVLIFRDSFAGNLLPYISQTFGKVEYIWDHNMNAYKEKMINDKPDIVIFEMVERYAHILQKSILPKE